MSLPTTAAHPPTDLGCRPWPQHHKEDTFRPVNPGPPPLESSRDAPSIKPDVDNPQRKHRGHAHLRRRHQKLQRQNDVDRHCFDVEKVHDGCSARITTSARPKPIRAAFVNMSPRYRESILTHEIPRFDPITFRDEGVPIEGFESSGLSSR